MLDRENKTFHRAVLREFKRQGNWPALKKKLEKLIKNSYLAKQFYNRGEAMHTCGSRKS